MMKKADTKSSAIKKLRPLQNSDKRLHVRRTGRGKPQHTEVCEAFKYRSNAKVGWLNGFCNGLKLLKRGIPD